MKPTSPAIRIFAVFLTVIILAASVSFEVFAESKKFSPIISTDKISVRTQYAYDENNPSWLRKLVVKEDLYSAEGIATESVLYPVASYPYRTDAPCFKEEVADYVKAFTLDESSRKAAYIYVLNQIGALDLIASAPPEGQSKADWLRERGIVVTPDDETNPDSVVMINALYSLMKNDFYYVITGNHIEIPEGTTLEAAVMMYLIALSDTDSKLSEFLAKYFANTNILTLEDYIFYTSLMTLFTNGYVSVRELPKMTHEEVYRRLAIMTIRNAGISVDIENVTTEELQTKYLAAMLGIQYSISVDPQSLEKEIASGTVAYYILRRMAYEDASVTVSSTKYTYEQAFDIVKKQTTRFNLENKFYSDISEYNIYLKNRRDAVYINPTPLSTSGATVYIDDTKTADNKYSKIALTADRMQVITLTVKYSLNGKNAVSYYRLKVYQGTTAPEGSDITGIIGTAGDVSVVMPSAGNVVSGVVDAVVPGVSKINGVLPSLYDIVGNAVSINENGQLVDKDGNVINDPSYTLPDGYKYAIDSAGKIVVVPIDTESTTASSTATQAENTGKTVRILIIVGSALFLIAIIMALVIVFNSNAKKKKNKSAYYASRKAKEKAKKAKKEARLEKRAKKNNK